MKKEYNNKQDISPYDVSKMNSTESNYDKENMQPIQISGFKRCINDNYSDDQEQLSNRSLQKLSDIDSEDKPKVSFKEDVDGRNINLKTSLETVDMDQLDTNLLDQDLYNA